MSQENPKPAVAKEIKVYQEKSKLFRVVHANGVWVSMNAYGDLHISFYSERAPIPTAVYIGIAENGDVIGELPEKREGKKDSWFREVEVDVVLSMNAAKSVQQALTDWIAAAEKAQKPA